VDASVTRAVDRAIRVGYTPGMAEPIRVDVDYRSVILPKSAKREVEICTRPTREGLAVQASHYAPILDRFLPADRAASILELGCGWGPFLRALKDRGYSRLEAVEMVPECCAAVEQHTGVVPFCGDILSYLAGRDGPYDVIAAFDVIEHFTKNEIVGIMERILKLLRPGGVFVMRVPNCSSLGGLSSLHSGFTHETAFTPTSADELLRAMGFTAIEVMHEPIFARTAVRRALKIAMKRAFGYFVSAGTAFAVTPHFATSHNLIAAARKP